MHENYVHHNIVQKDNTTIMPENIYARRDWVHTGFPHRESAMRGTYNDLELVQSFKTTSTYNSFYESERNYIVDDRKASGDTTREGHTYSA